MNMRIFFPYGKAPFNYGSWGVSNNNHGNNSYQPLAFGVTQHGNNSRISPCNWPGGSGHLMRNCHDLVQELMKHAKNRHQYGCPQPTFHSHVVSEEVANNTDSFENIYVVDVFDIALIFLDLEQVDITWLVDSGAFEHVMIFLFFIFFKFKSPFNSWCSFHCHMPPTWNRRQRLCDPFKDWWNKI